MEDERNGFECVEKEKDSDEQKKESCIRSCVDEKSGCVRDALEMRLFFFFLRVQGEDRQESWMELRTVCLAGWGMYSGCLSGMLYRQSLCSLLAACFPLPRRGLISCVVRELAFLPDAQTSDDPCLFVLN